jgi:hypothetical protein
MTLITSMIAGTLNWPARWYKPGSDAANEAFARAMVELLFQGVRTGIGATRVLEDSAAGD